MITKLRLRCMAIAMFISVCGAFAQTADFSGFFGGTTIGDGSVYTFPIDAEGWAGFANNNTALYPLSFSEDGGIAFTAAAPNGDVNIKFKFEFKPHPDIEPSYTTEDILISGADEASYSVAVPAQGDKTFSSLLMYVVERDLGVTVKDVVVTADELATPVDGGSDGGDDDSSSATEYCAKEVTHFNIAGHAGSILLTIENSGENSIDVTATSVADVIDLLVIEGLGVANASPTDITDGVATTTISWAAGTMPATTTFGVMWSDEASDGNQMVRPGDTGDALGNVNTADACPTDGGGSDDGDDSTPTTLKLTVTAPGATSVGITGPWWSWGATGPVATSNGDGTWTAVFDPAPTDVMEYKWLIDGVQEDLITAAAAGQCTAEIDAGTLKTDYSTWGNRYWLLDSGDRSETASACSGTPLPAPEGQVYVTFQVDMNAPNFNAHDSVYIAGGGFTQDGHLLTDDGSGIWSVTLALNKNAQQTYKFRNQPAYGGWDGFEEADLLASGGCGIGTFNDRFVDVLDSDTTLALVAYSSCTAVAPIYGCTDENANNTNDLAVIDGLDADGNSVCTYATCEDVPNSGGCVYEDAFGYFVDGGFNAADCENGDAEAFACIAGCLDQNAENYTPTITIDPDTYNVTIANNSVCEYPIASFPINFEGGANIEGFDGGSGSYVDNPYKTGNTSDKVGQIIRDGGATWAGATILMDTTIDFSALSSISMDVYTTADVGTSILFKLEGEGYAQRENITTVSGEWETLSWDFETEPRNFDKLVLMFDFGSTGDGSESSTFYFDNIRQVEKQTVVVETDTDEDGIPDLTDTDDDGDGVADADDILPLDKNFSDQNEAIFTGPFGGTSLLDSTDVGMFYTFPSGAEAWAGFSNENDSLYPLSFPYGAKIDFTASVATGGDADVRFRFEKNPHPDVDPHYNTEAVTVSGANANYSVEIPSQGANEFRSYLLYLDTRDVAVHVSDVIITPNAAPAPVEGCTDAAADNYNAAANSDDNSCTYSGPIFTANFDEATDADAWGGTAVDGALYLRGFHSEGGPLKFVYSESDLSFKGASKVSLSFDIKISDPLVSTAIHLFTELPGLGRVNTFNIENGIGNTEFKTVTYTFDGITGNGNFLMEIELAAGAAEGAGGGILIDNISLTEFVAVPGCTDNTATNYDPAANVDDNDTCTYPGKVNVTFQVDMSHESSVHDSVYIAGGGFGQDGHLLTDNGSDVWSVTLELDPNAQYTYKFRNQPSYGTWDGFEDQAGLIDGGCNTGQHNDRYVDVAEADTVLAVVAYGSCTADAPPVLGCTDESADNYKPSATKDDGSCVTVSIPDAPVPTEAAENVLSIFSNAYTNVEGTDFDPRWGQVTAVAVTDVLTYSGLDFQGTQFPGQDVSGYEYVNVDFYTEDATEFSFTIISPGQEKLIPLTVTLDQWNSVQIPLTDYPNVNLADVIQFKVTGNGTVHVDNLYFGGKALEVPGCMDSTAVNYNDSATTDNGSCYDSPSTAAPTPTATADQVLSIFSSTYTSLEGIDYNPNWGQGTQVTVGDTLAYVGLNYQGTNIPVQDVSGYEYLHVDFFTSNSTDLGVFLINSTVAETEHNFEITVGEWNSVDIPLTTFDAVDLTKVDQIKVDGNGTIYFDNIYFGGSTALDSDGDGMADSVDPDDDNDGTDDDNDPLPLNADFSDKTMAAFSNSFGGATIDTGLVYTFPTGAEDWAGFVSMNAFMYPISIENDTAITFNAYVPSGDTVDVRFRFEPNAHPNNEPFYDTDVVTVRGSLNDSYSIPITAQDTTYNSFIMYLNTKDVSVVITDVGFGAAKGCTDQNAENYNANVEEQAYDENGNSSCVYLTCAEAPVGGGCIYADGFGTFNDQFGDDECTEYGGTSCVVEGCLDDNASNYLENANTQSFDDLGYSSCVYESCDKVPSTGGCRYADGFGLFEDGGLNADNCETTQGEACIVGCMDVNASDYDEKYSIQATDQYNNIVCSYSGCANTPNLGCIYANADDEATHFGAYTDGFGPTQCTDNGGIACDESKAACIDEEAANFDASASSQALDQYGNILCDYTITDADGVVTANCDAVPEDGCVYPEGEHHDVAHFGAYSEDLGHVMCTDSYNGLACGTKDIVIPGGCMDEDATNYEPNATEQAVDQWGNILCTYESCADIPEDSGCRYDDKFAEYHSDFDGADCVFYEGEDCKLPTSGCIYLGAVNYSEDATIQATDNYGNIMCEFTSCDDVPAEGCLYGEKFGFFDGDFDATACADQGQGITCVEEVPSEGPTSQTIDLPSGWSMFSSYLVSESMDMEVALASIIDKVIIAKNNDGKAYLVEWDFNGVGDMLVGQGYQIKTSEAVTLELTGTHATPEANPINLVGGWNMIGYLATDARDAKVVLADINGSGNLVIAKDYNGKAYLPEYDFNGIGDMVPGQGYQMKTNTADVLSYASGSVRSAAKSVMLEEVKHFEKPSLTDNNMTVVLEDAAWDAIPEEGAEVAAYDQAGNLIGSAVYSSPVTVMSVWGDDATTSLKDGLSAAEIAEFKVWNAEGVKNFNVKDWSKGSAAYTTNAINVASSINTINTIAELNSSSTKELVKVVNILGQEVHSNDVSFVGTVFFNIYDDGSVEKIVK